MRKTFVAIIMFVTLAAARETAAAWSDWAPYYTAGTIQGTTTLAMAPGEIREVTLRVVNEGTYRWRGAAPGWRYVSLYTVEPYARKSVFQTDSWHSSVQPTILAQSIVEPGETGTFSFEIRAPREVGHYKERFRLAIEDTTWIWNGDVVLDITVDPAAGLEQARAALRSVLATRADLRALFGEDWQPIASPKTVGIADLEDWARKYGYKEHPSQLDWYSPARETVAVAPPPPASTPPALAVVPSAPSPRHDGVPFPTTTLTADRVVVIDDVSKRVLFEKNADATHPIASITKLMTSMVVLERTVPMWRSLALEQQDEVGGARLRVDVGTPLTVSDLMYATLVGSANNTAHALARSTGLTIPQFVARMNEKADELGLVRTDFADPTGLELGNVGTAREVAALAVNAFERYTIRKMTSTQKITLDTGVGLHTITNTNGLLVDDSNGLIVLGGKTGYLIESQWNLVVRMMDARRRPLIIVVLGADTKDQSFNEAHALAKWAWDHHAW